MKSILKNRLPYIVALVFICAIALVLSLSFFSVKGGRIEGEMVSQTEIKDSYYLNDSITVAGAKISVGGTEYLAESITLFYPDGSAKSGDTFIFDKIGTYTLEFEGKNGDSSVYCKKIITVYERSVTIPSNSKCEYVSELSTLNNGKSGLDVELMVSSEFIFNKAIDLNGASVKGSPLITFLPYQYSLNKTNTELTVLSTTYKAVEPQAKVFYVKLTDCYDENELYSGKPCYYYPNFSARSNGQDFRSLNAPSASLNKYGELVNIDGIQYLAKYQSWAGTYEWSNLKNNGEISIYFDYEKSRLYGTYPGASTMFFADVSSEALFGDNAFKGFTTGEVYLSIYASDYVSDRINFTVSEIYGNSGEDLSSLGVVDTVKPKVNVQLDTNKTYYVAKNSEVIIPEATVYDVNLLKLNKRVYYMYGTDKQVSISVKDGKFIPTMSGEYVIEYVATDLFGNKSEPVVIKLNSTATASGSVIDFNVSKLPSEVGAGKVITVPSVSMSGLNGGATLKSYFYKNDAPDVVTEFSAGDQIMFEELGEYTVVYEYGEFFEQKVYSYTVSAVASDEIIFTEAVLPKYFIKNAVYTLDAVNAYSFAGGAKHQTDVSYFIKEDEKEYVSIDYSSVKITASDKVQFKYVSEGKEVYSSEITVVDVGFMPGDFTLGIENYFYGDFEATSSYKGVQLISNVNSGSNSFEFINPVSISKFQFIFKSVANMANFNEVKIELTDYYDRDKKVVLGFREEAGVMTYYAGGVSSGVAVNFAKSDFTVFYDEKTSNFIDGTGQQLTWYNDFSSDFALMKVTVGGITGASGLEIKEVSGQLIDDSEQDYYTSAFIGYKNLYGGVVEIDSNAVIYPAYAVDVLSPFNIAGMKVAVSDSEGKYVSTEDGTLLDGTVTANKEYVIKFTAYGQYNVNYLYTDAYGNPSTSSYNIYVTDTTDPTIVLDDGVNENSIDYAELDKEYKIKGYTVSDNLPIEKLKVDTFVIRNGTKITKVVDGVITFTSAGEYKVLYYCYDEAGNYACASYYVSVK